MNAALTSKLGINVFKPGATPHIRIKPGMGKDVRLRHAVSACPAGLYTQTAAGDVVLGLDGCLECGTCLLVCGTEVLEWHYPEGGTGIQYRFG